MTSRLKGENRTAPTSFTKLTTSSVPMSDRLDFWQNQFASCEISRPTADGEANFRSDLLRCSGGDGSAFVHIAGDPVVCSFGRRESGLVIVGYVRAGTINVSHDDEQTTVLDSNSGVVLMDCDRRFVTASTHYELAQLVLPRSLVTNIIGGNSTVREKAVTKLPNSGLAPIVRAQLDAMSRHGAALNRAEAAAAMHAATLLAVAMLSSIDQCVDRKSELDEYLFAAAKRYIEAHASRHDLTSASIAAAVGCSRAHLYRLFANRATQVGDLLREVRLGRARTLIETRLRRPIGLIAFDCGYTDLSAFGKAFRRRYGLSPGTYRREAIHQFSVERH